MLRRILLMSVAFIAMWGCTQTNPHRQDPFEGLNRATFSFNKVVDSAFAKPIAYLYLRYLPAPFQVGIGNFFDNLREIPNVANDILQLKFGYAAHDGSRFLINSTLGIFGIFDPASALGLEHRKEDFGQTLYFWGYENSSYLVLPILGPSTFRDAIGIGVDYYALSIWPWIESDWKYAFLAVDFIDLRARLLRKESVLDVLAVDEYSFVRDAYFQHRKYLFMDSEAGNADDDIYGDELDDQNKKEANTTQDQPVNASDASVATQNGDTSKKNETENATKSEKQASNSKKDVSKNAKNELTKDLQVTPQKKDTAATTQSNSATKANLSGSKAKNVPQSASTPTIEKVKAQESKILPLKTNEQNTVKGAKQKIKPASPTELKKTKVGSL